MTTRTKPPFRADHVGSLLRPQALLDARVRWKAGEMTDDELRAEENKHIAAVVRLQKSTGIGSVTDG
jgi:5-methyltetrahydropteroyltriglutamate--homocysteine methyltransferase